MTTDEKPIVDPATIFGGNLQPVAPANQMPDLPADLDRTGEAAPTLNAEEQQYANEDPDADKPAFTTQVDEQGQTELTVEGGETAHSDPHAGPAPEHAPIGHNQPEEEPMSREDMIKEFNRDIAAYGKASGQGASALPRLGLRVIRAAADGLISNEKPKDGSKSDAVRIYEKYAEQDSKHAEHTKGGMKANAAKVNALIGLGCMTTVDGVEIAARTVKLREQMEEADAKPKALFAGLVDVARAQMEEDQPLSDDAIKAALGKTVKDKTVAEEWGKIYKSIEKLVSGENPQGLRDDSDRAHAIAQQVSEHINNFAAAETESEEVAWCMERGMTREAALAFVRNR